MVFQKLKLPRALELYPDLWKLTLFGEDSSDSSMSEVISGIVGGSTYFSKRYKQVDVFIALKDWVPIGWVWAIPRGLDETKSGYLRKHFVSWIYVSPDYRRNKVGTYLFGFVKNLAEERKLPVYVEPWDSCSDSFFEKTEGVPLSEINYSPTGE